MQYYSSNDTALSHRNSLCQKMISTVISAVVGNHCKCSAHLGLTATEYIIGKYALIMFYVGV